MPGQNRGVHLICILSQTVERIIGHPMAKFLGSEGYGDAQWAFRKMTSARDLVTVCVAWWVLLICQGRKIGSYLSDISGAFDKGSRCSIIGKLSQIGLSESFLDVLNSYLLIRQGSVRVEGAVSEAMLLTDMVFQGTVLGPSFWNAFFGDIADHVHQGRQLINLFADGLTVKTHAPQHVNESVILEKLRGIQTRTHDWGRQIQIEFDGSKEFFNILHPACGSGEDFKLLDTLVDNALTMKPCIEGVLGKIRPKIRALLRLKHFYSLPAMLGQYKCHVWGLKEYSDGAIIIAAPTQLERLDKVQQ